MLHIQLLEWSKRPIMTSSNDKSTNKQSKSQKHQLWQPKFTQAQVPVHIYADTGFIFSFNTRRFNKFNTRRSKHFVTRYRLRQHKSPQAERTLSAYAWEAGAEMKSSASGARSGYRSVLVHARTEGNCQSTTPVVFWMYRSSSESTSVAVPLAAVILFLVTWASRSIQLM